MCDDFLSITQAFKLELELFRTKVQWNDSRFYCTTTGQNNYVLRFRTTRGFRPLLKAILLKGPLHKSMSIRD